jgi:hypothetical protein
LSSEQASRLQPAVANSSATRLFLIEHKSAFVVSLLLICGLVFRCYQLSAVGFWLDETFQYYFATKNIGQLLFIYGSDQAPLIFYLSKLQMMLSPWQSEGILRFPSVIFGTMTIFACYKLGKVSFSQEVGIVTATLAVFTPILVGYSQEYRMYALFVLLSTCTAYWAIIVVQTNDLKAWSWFSFFSIANLYTHYNALFPLAAAFAFFAIAFASRWIKRCRVPGERWKQAWALLSNPMRTGLVIAAAYIPGIAFLANFIQSPDLGLARAVGAPPFNSTALLDTLAKLGFGAGVALFSALGLAILGLIWSLLRRPWTGVFCLLWVSFPFLAARFVKGGTALLLSARYLIFFTPVYLLLIAIGIAALCSAAIVLFGRYRPVPAKQPGAASQIIAALLVAMLLTQTIPLLQQYYRHPKSTFGFSIETDAREAFGYVHGDLQPGDVVLGFAGTVPNSGHDGWFQYYYSYYMRDKLPEVALLIGSDITSRPALSNILGSHGRLWTVITYGGDTSKLLQLAGPGAQGACYTNICAIKQPTTKDQSTISAIKAFFQNYRSINEVEARKALTVLSQVTKTSGEQP